MAARTFRFFPLTVLVVALLAACDGGSSPSAPPRPSMGSLQLEISGLPAGTDALVRLSGVGGYDETFCASRLLEGLTPGRYTLTASNVPGASETYTPTPALSSVDLFADQTATATINYQSSGGSSLDLRIPAAYLVQSTQRLDGGVPLIAGRAAMVRVFATANRAALVRPDVEVQLFDAADKPIASYTIAARLTAMPIAVDEGSLNASWMVAIPADQIEVGMKFLAQVDPAAQLAETDETNNFYPFDRQPLELDVRELSDLMVRFIPVEQAATGLTGDVSANNKSDYTELAQKLYPTANTITDVGATFTTQAPALQPDDANDAWITVLNEIWAAQQVDPVRTRHHYGVVDVTYSSGIAGIAYIGQPAGIGRDLRHPSLAVVFPHELGHNLGLPHANCGVSGGDPNYPYPNGQIGVYGFDVATGGLKEPSLADIMGYCSNIWISDYNYELAMDFREHRSKRPRRMFKDESEPCYLLWGRFDADGATLEPVLELDAPAVLPAGGGPHRLELQLDDGSWRSVEFEGELVADRPGGPKRQFAFLLPVASLGPARLARVALRTASGRLDERVATESSASKEGPRISVLRGAADRVHLDWDAGRFPMLCVQDAASGEILSFARRGRSQIAAHGRELTISASDGLNSRRQTFFVD